MIGNIILAVVILILLLAAVVVVRTCILQPTPAMTAKVELQENERAAAYGEALAKMIRKETVSSRFEEDKAQAFTFRLEKEDGANTGKWVSAGGQPYQLIPGTGETASDGKTAENGEFTLTHGQTAKFTVLAGRNYRIAGLH